LFKLFRKRRCYVCLVCGYGYLSRPLYNRKGLPNIGLICNCCGFQPGYDDTKLETTIEEYREYWILGGTLWFDDKKKPKDWDFKQQLANINIRD